MPRSSGESETDFRPLLYLERRIGPTTDSSLVVDYLIFPL